MAFFRLKDSQGCWENPAKDQPRCALAVTVTLVINRYNCIVFIKRIQESFSGS